MAPRSDKKTNLAGQRNGLLNRFCTCKVPAIDRKLKRAKKERRRNKKLTSN